MNLATTQGEVSVKTDINLASKPDNKRGYLIDIDGVIYRGNKLILGSDHFIQALLDIMQHDKENGYIPKQKKIRRRPKKRKKDEEED